jgi:trehalose 6-phosphate synthase
MDAEERRLRSERLRVIVDARDPGDWVDEQMADIRAKRGGRELVG